MCQAYVPLGSDLPSLVSLALPVGNQAVLPLKPFCAFYAVELTKARKILRRLQAFELLEVLRRTKVSMNLIKISGGAVLARALVLEENEGGRVPQTSPRLRLGGFLWDAHVRCKCACPGVLVTSEVDIKLSSPCRKIGLSRSRQPVSVADGPLKSVYTIGTRDRITVLCPIMCTTTRNP